MPQLSELWQATGIAQLTGGQAIMMAVGGVLVWLAIARRFEPLLLLPIGVGTFLANVPGAGMAEAGGLLDHLYVVGVKSGVFPLMIFIAVGAMTDLSAVIARPSTLILGAAAQLGIFATLIGALLLNALPSFDFSVAEAAAIGIIGGADGPTAIFLASRLAPDLLGAIAVAAYSYMALVPIIQPPIMKALTTEEERARPMEAMRPVGKVEKILFPCALVGLCALFLPAAAPLVGSFALGNLLQVSGVTDRLAEAARVPLGGIVTLLLGLAIGTRLSAEAFLEVRTIGILVLGIVAFSAGTASGVLMGKLLGRLTNGAVNPLIGAAGVSAVPMAARVAHKVGQEANPRNALLMHAMGPNVAGVIGSAVAAGVLLALLGSPAS